MASFYTYLKTEDGTLKSNIMSALYFSEQEAIDYSLEQSFNHNMGTGDKSNAVIGAYYINKDQSPLYNWMEKNF